MTAGKRVLYQTFLQLIFTFPWAIGFGVVLNTEDSNQCSGRLFNWSKFAFIINVIYSSWAIITATFFYFGFKTYYEKLNKPIYLALLQIIQYFLAILVVVSFFGVFFALMTNSTCPVLEIFSRMYVVVNFILFMVAYALYMMVNTCLKRYRKYYNWSIEEMEGLNRDTIK